MKIEITQQTKNPLMKREDIWVKVSHDGAATPRRKELLPHISKTLKTKDNLVIIRKIFSDTGRNTSTAKVFVYSKTEDVPRAMAEKMQRQLKKGKQPEPAAEAPKEEKKAEKPAEAPKEEAPKAEEKKETPAKEEAKPEEKPVKEEPKTEEKKE